MTKFSENNTEDIIENLVKLSIIVPIYNAEKYLKNCVKSILNNTGDDVEILLIDDGSPDKSGEIADKISKTDKRVKVFHKPNGGVSSARNFGLNKAKGEYVAFADSDDLICNDLSSFVNVIKGKDLACFDYYLYKSNTNDQIDIEKLRKLSSWNSPCNKLFNLKFLNDGEIRFDQDLKIAEDLKFVLTCLNKTNNFCESKDAYYVYVQNDSSVMSSVGFGKICNTLDVCKWEIGQLETSKNRNLCKKLVSENLLSVLIRINNYAPDENQFLLNELKKLKKYICYGSNIKKKIVVFLIKIFGIKITSKIVKKLL